MKRRLCLLIVVGFTSGSPRAAALAQSGAAPPETPSTTVDSADLASTPPLQLADDLEIAVTVGAWLPRLGGETQLGPSAAAQGISVENKFDLDDLEATFNLEVMLRRNEMWGLFFGAFDFSTNASGVFPSFEQFGALSLSPGDPYRASFDITSVNLEVSTALWRPFGAEPEHRSSDGSPPDIDFRFSPGLGFRYVQVDQSVTQTGVGKEKGRAQWLFPYAWLGMDLRWGNEDDEVPWMHMLELSASFGIGPAVGGDGGYMWQVRAGVTWHFTPNAAATFGYRLLELDAQDDEFDVQAGLQGLHVGATFRF